MPRLQAEQPHGAEGSNPKDPKSKTIRMSKRVEERDKKEMGNGRI